MIPPHRALVAPSLRTLRFLRHITTVPILEPATKVRCLQRPNFSRRCPCPIFSRRSSSPSLIRSEAQRDAEYTDKFIDWVSVTDFPNPATIDWDQPFSREVEKARSMLEAGRIDDVRANWEDLMYQPSDTIPGERKEFVFHQIARDLMRALQKAGRHMEIPAIFHILATRSPLGVPMDVNLLNKCLDAYSRGHRWDRVLNVFQWHARKTTPDEYTYELCMMALMGQEQYEMAWEMIARLEQSSLPPSPKCLVIYLKGLRKAGTSLGDMLAAYEALKEMAEKRDGKPSPEVINVLLEEALMAGNPELGDKFLSELTSNGYPPSAATYSAFLSAQAVAKDWDSVGTTVETMKMRGYPIPFEKTNILLRNFSRDHDAEQTENFIEVMANEGAQVATSTYNLLLQRYIDETKYEQALEVVQKMKGNGHPPNSMTVRIIFEMLRNKHIEHRPALAHLMRSIYDVHPSLIPPKLHKMWDYNKSLRQLKPTYDHDTALQWDPIVQGMEAAIREEYPLQALSIFRENLPSAKGPLPGELLDAVIKAFIALPGPPTPESDPESGTIPSDHSTSPTIEQRDVRPIPFQIAYALERHFHTHIDTAIATSSPPLPIILATYKFKDHYLLPISHDAAVHAASKYCTFAQPLAAIHIMNDVSKSPWGKRIPWDLNALTVLLRAYAIMKDIRGAQWVCGRLIEGGFIPDKRVVVYLNYARRGGEQEVKAAVEKLGHWLRVHRKSARDALEGPVSTMVQGLMESGIREGKGMSEWKDWRWMERRRRWAMDKKKKNFEQYQMSEEMKNEKVMEGEAAGEETVQSEETKEGVAADEERIESAVDAPENVPSKSERKSPPISVAFKPKTGKEWEPRKYTEGEHRFPKSIRTHLEKPDGGESM
ncbi:hypothetical protein EX30DRAFT_339402 [Ascodesmis nigricans]|uniref:Pentacotripeptide-repeat region of PRORP domain-containing protein n=1 Tax=Ascodesmis nigricans TaxID=341454 RepID=A0A4S2N2P1_9PEZI|nr:hypothetical protein EX30DRAFT_339402 [Ascodesmis nigricans]